MSAAKMESKQASKEANDAANDPARALAYVLRGNKGPEARSARLEDSRVDYFRGKDLYRALKARPEIIDEYAPKLTGVPTPTAPTEKDRNKQITAMGQELLKRGYFVKCDRVYKTPRPGRTKRVKFPKFLHQVPRAAQTFTEDGEGFYSWTYDQPMSWTFVIISFLVAFMVILMCLFPLSPIWFKKLILYFCLAILGLFFVVGVVRVFVFAVVWIVFGRHFWVLPNITSDEIPIDEVFSPMWAFDDLDANGNVVGKISAINRLAAAGSAAAALAALYAIAPEKGSAIKSINRAHGSILDLFDLYDTPKGLAGAAANATAAANASDGAGGAKKPAGNETDETAAGGETATAAGADDGHRTSDIDPLEEDVAPPAPPPPYGGPEAPEDGSAADAETKAEL
jgi:translocation protein SEC62